MIIQMLNKPNFWDYVEKENPLAFKKFKAYIDDFKASMNWDQLFNAGVQYGMGRPPAGPILTKSPKFHDLPFVLQKGVIEYFFILENIQFYTNRHPFNPENWTFSTIDTLDGKIWSVFENSEHKELKEFTTAEEADIASIRMAFQLLNDNYLKNFN